MANFMKQIAVLPVGHRLLNKGLIHFNSKVIDSCLFMVCNSWQNQLYAHTNHLYQFVNNLILVPLNFLKLTMLTEVATSHGDALLSMFGAHTGDRLAPLLYQTILPPLQYTNNRKIMVGEGG